MRQYVRSEVSVQFSETCDHEICFCSNHADFQTRAKKRLYKRSATLFNQDFVQLSVHDFFDKDQSFYKEIDLYKFLNDSDSTDQEDEVVKVHEEDTLEDTKEDLNEIDPAKDEDTDPKEDKDTQTDEKDQVVIPDKEKEKEGKDLVDPTHTDEVQEENSGKVTVEVEESDSASSSLMLILIPVIIAVVVALLVVLGIRYWMKKRNQPTQTESATKTQYQTQLALVEQSPRKDSVQSYQDSERGLVSP